MILGMRLLFDVSSGAKREMHASLSTNRELVSTPF
jgi:hypothetical protein